MNNPSPLPEGRIINPPYCLVVSEQHKDTAIRIVSIPNSGCWAVFVHHSPNLGEWMATEGIPVSSLMRDAALERVWHCKML